MKSGIRRRKKERKERRDYPQYNWF